jgi:hypothetical protein
MQHPRNPKRRLETSHKQCGGTWPTSNKDLIAKYLGAFTTFITSIDFESLTQ